MNKYGLNICVRISEATLLKIKKINRIKPKSYPNRSVVIRKGIDLLLESVKDGK